MRMKLPTNMRCQHVSRYVLCVAILCVAILCVARIACLRCLQVTGTYTYWQRRKCSQDLGSSGILDCVKQLLNQLATAA